MPMLRKVLPAMHAPGAQSCDKRRDRDPSSLSLAQVTATLERFSRQVALRGGKATVLPPGVVRDNALLLEQNDFEIRKLTKPGVQS